MRLIAILSWFDERPAWLAGVIASLVKAEVRHVIAVDGAYGLYPNGRGYSGPEQHATIVEVCRALEMGCTIHTPAEPWWGNEVEKRTAAFRLAETVAVPFEDWYLLVDADHFVTSSIGSTKRLEQAEDDVAEVQFNEPYGALPSGGPLRCVLRAIPGLYYNRNHYSPTTPDGVDLHAFTTPALDLHCMEIEHRTAERDPYRKELQQHYYRRRDEAGVECAVDTEVAA